MTVFARYGLLYVVQRRMLQGLLPWLAGLLMIIAGLLPWLIDPLGQIYTAWNVPVDIGWQVRSGFCSYGLLCCGCGLYICLAAYLCWEGRNAPRVVGRRSVPGSAIVLCLLPTIMFFLQYLCIDANGIDRLAQHEVQMLLIAQHFGYNSVVQRLPINPFSFDASTLWGHLQLFVNQAEVGWALPCMSACLLLSYRRVQRSHGLMESNDVQRVRWGALLFPLGILLLALLYVRPLMAVVCDYQAKNLLTTGNYVSALQWLDKAQRFNPALDDVAYYHIERGQALYFLKLDQQSSDSQVYLAFAYRGQHGYLDAYQQMLSLWQTQRTTPWVVDQMDQTLQHLTENVRPLDGLSGTITQRGGAALVWVQLLTRVDPTNVYGSYMLARIQYELSNFTAARSEMVQVIHLSGKSEIESSAYTYMALSDAGLGNYVEARVLLFKAVALDPDYRNNTARENLSGLR